MLVNIFREPGAGKIHIEPIKRTRLMVLLLGERMAPEATDDESELSKLMAHVLVVASHVVIVLTSSVQIMETPAFRRIF